MGEQSASRYCRGGQILRGYKICSDTGTLNALEVQYTSGVLKGKSLLGPKYMVRAQGTNVALLTGQQPVICITDKVKAFLKTAGLLGFTCRYSNSYWLKMFSSRYVACLPVSSKWNTSSGL